LNIKELTIRKYASELLGLKYNKYDECVTRSAIGLTTERDVSEFCGLLSTCFEVGYLKAVEDYRKQLEDMGMSVTVRQVNS
jgi:hypothetical protein